MGVQWATPRIAEASDFFTALSIEQDVYERMVSGESRCLDALDRYADLTPDDWIEPLRLL